ncbi:MAG: NADH-ubiquinone oxidoreductase, partial [Acetobacteraceae bacterium]
VQVHIIGASGRSGVALCRSLLTNSRPPVPIVRDAAKWHATGIGIAPRIANLGDAASLTTALADATDVVCCAHASHAQAVIDAAPAAAHLFFLGSTRKFTRWPDAHGNGVIAGECAFLASGRDGVMLHPTMIYGAQGEDNVQRLAALLRRLPIVPLPGGGKALVQPIHQDDVSRCIRAALEIAWDDPHSLVIAGPGPLPYFAFVQQVARAAGLRPPRWIALPAWSLMAGAWLSQFVPLLPTVRPAEIRRLLEDKAFDIAPMRAALNVQPIALPEGLARTFAPIR